MIAILMNPGPEVLLGLMCLATFRIYLEVIGFDFRKLPLTRALGKRSSEDSLVRFHRLGLLFSIGFILLFAPTLIF